MLMAIKNLSITQNCIILWYTYICSRAYGPQLQRFSEEDYIYLQYEVPIILDVQVGCIILHVPDVLPSGILLLTGNNR